MKHLFDHCLGAALLLALAGLLPRTAAAQAAKRPHAAATQATKRPADVIPFVQDGKTYYATTKGPGFAVGVYLYEGKGEPKAELQAGNKGGYFQRHQTAPDPIVWWGWECDATGKLWDAHNENTGRHFHNVVVKYGGSQAYPVPGSYDRMQLSFDQSKVYLMGEREKSKF